MESQIIFIMNNIEYKIKHHCDLCRADKPLPTSSTGKSGMVYCGKCGFIYRYLRPDEKRLKNFYGQEWYFHEGYQKGNEKVTGSYLADKNNIMRFVRKRYKTISQYKKGGDLLDIGSAMGFYLDYFKNHGWKVHGVEISEYAAKYAQNQLGIKDIFIGDINQASYASGSFDVITLWLILEHLVNPLETLKRIHDWLKKDGIIGLKVPTISGITGKLRPAFWFRKFHPQDHMVAFTIESLREMLERIGFEMLEYKTEGIYLDRAAKALRIPPNKICGQKKIEMFYQKLAFKMDMGDSLVMFGRKIK